MILIASARRGVVLMLLAMASAVQAQQAVNFSGADLQSPSASVREAVAQIQGGTATQVRKVLEQSAADGDIDAALVLGHCWEYGIGGEASSARALAIFEDAADRGSAVAMRRMGVLYHTGGVGLRSDIRAARQWFEKADALGDAAATLELARLYEEGLGVPVDIDRALFLCRKAAENGLVNAMIHLGDCAMKGVGQEGIPNEPLALDWFQMAADAGSALGMFNVGRSYDSGKAGLPMDPVKAFDWIKKAAETGLMQAQNEIAKRYREGHGVEVNVAEAFRWFGKAAAQRFPAAMVNLGVMYQQGVAGVVEKNENTAGVLFIEAARRNDRVGQFLLSRLYASGAGVPEDPVAAYVLADESLRRGYKPAGKLKDSLKKELTPGQLKAAEARLRSARGGSADANGDGGNGGER